MHTQAGNKKMFGDFMVGLPYTTDQCQCLLASTPARVVRPPRWLLSRALPQYVGIRDTVLYSLASSEIEGYTEAVSDEPARETTLHTYICTQ